MNKQKLQIITIVGLLISNLLLIGFILFKKPPHPPAHLDRKSPREVVINKLDLDESQVVAYDKLIKKHRILIEGSDRQVRELKRALYLNLKVNNQADQENMLKELAALQAEIEQTHINHFLEIKSLLKKEEQVKKFELLSEELADIFAPHHGPKR